MPFGPFSLVENTVNEGAGTESKTSLGKVAKRKNK